RRRRCQPGVMPVAPVRIVRGRCHSPPISGSTTRCSPAPVLASTVLLQTAPHLRRRDIHRSPHHSVPFSCNRSRGHSAPMLQSMDPSALAPLVAPGDRQALRNLHRRRESKLYLFAAPLLPTTPGAFSAPTLRLGQLALLLRSCASRTHGRALV